MAAEPNTLDVEENVRRVLRMLMARDGIKEKHIAAALGTSRQTVNNKLRGVTRLTIDELGVLAAHFEVDVALFFDPDRPIPRAPATWAVRNPAPDLLTCTFNALPQVRAYGLADLVRWMNLPPTVTLAAEPQAA
jgi:transcriptional regulator with XRE-family HTH domain